MQRYTIRLFLQNALHVSGGSSAHHQELKNYANIFAEINELCIVDLVGYT
jgi:hypothetical protein